MIRLNELLEDPVYKAYFCKVPKLPDVAYLCSTPPWRLQILYADKSWGSVDFDKYADAFRSLKANLKAGDVKDGAITSRRVQFAPPIRKVRIKGKFVTDPKSGVKVQATTLLVWKPKLDPYEESHNWCPYCRRPTVFRYFRKHHALPAIKIGKGVQLDPTVLRCSICAASERIVKL